MSDTLNTELQAIEAQLEKLSAAPMPEDMIARMEEAMVNWELNLPAEEKIVPFTDSTTSQKKSTFTTMFNTWGAVAAVALIAATSYLFMDNNSEVTSNAGSTVASHSVIEQQPQHFSHNIIDASNDAITYAGADQKPYRVVRFHYTKDVETTDENGKTVVIQKPAVETILIPIESK